MDSTQSIAQTFTAGLSGGADQVDLSLLKSGTPTAPLIVELRDASGGMPGSTVLASQSVPQTSVAGTATFLTINFPTPAPVVAGTQYAIVAYSATTFPNQYIWTESANANPNPYPGGMFLFTSNSPPSGSWGSAPLEDLAFKTYVVVPPPPTTTPPVTTSPVTAPTVAPTGQRDAALKKCKKKFKRTHNKKAFKKCKKKANLLPV